MKYRLVTATFRLDAAGNVLNVTDANTNTTNLYDDFNRLTSATDNMYNPAKVIQYTYYDDGARKEMTSPEGEVIVYTYDKARRLLTVSRNSTRVAEYVYNALGQRTNLYFGSDRNGAHTDYGYDNTTRWLTSVSNITSTGGTVSSFTYVLDKTGQRTKLTYLNGDYVSYGYDAVYHLTSEQKKDNLNNTLYTNVWTYDDVGNRLTQTQNSITVTNYAYNNANQLISDTVSATTNLYNYDANGNQIRKGDGLSITYTWTYNYDNRVISYYDPLTSSNNTTYTTDAMGRRIEKNKNGTVTRFLLDGANVIVDYNSANNPIAQYVTPFLDQNLLIITNTNTYYYVHDGLGSVRNLVSSVQSVVNTYDYNAFGESVSATQQVTQRYRFAGREWDFESSTYYNNFRQYNQATGRFLGRDPIEYGGGINLYNYCFSNPVNGIDPFGLKTIATETPNEIIITLNIQFWFDGKWFSNSNTYDPDNHNLTQDYIRADRLASRIANTMVNIWNEMTPRNRYGVKRGNQVKPFRFQGRYQVTQKANKSANDKEIPAVTEGDFHVIHLHMGRGRCATNYRADQGESPFKYAGGLDNNANFTGDYYEQSDDASIRIEDAWAHEAGHLMGLGEGYFSGVPGQLPEGRMVPAFEAWTDYEAIRKQKFDNYKNEHNGRIPTRHESESQMEALFDKDIEGNVKTKNSTYYENWASTIMGPYDTRNVTNGMLWMIVSERLNPKPKRSDITVP